MDKAISWLMIFVLGVIVVGCGDEVQSKRETSGNNGELDAGTNNSTTNNSTTNNSTTNSDPMLCGNGALDPGELCDSGIATGPGSCPNACAGQSACQVGTVTGTAATCSASCTFTEITACQGGDGCCPGGCTSGTDSDCSATCGNGTVDQGETCDGNCPTTCSDNQACTTDELVGSAANCTASCSFVPITSCQGGDGCCPNGCTANNDSDCTRMCGNGIVEPGETCDGNCPASCVDNDACTADSIAGSPGSCNVVCTNSPISVCQSGDGCCPSGCTYPTDLDCPCTPAVCGGAGRECGNPSDGCGGTLSCAGCPAGSTCSNFECVPIVSNADIGDACTQDPDCTAGGYCGLNRNFKDGYCSKSCMFDNDCPGGSHCGNMSNGVGECLENCLTDADCRSGYECWNYDGDQNNIKECAPSGVGTKDVGEACQGVWECDGGTAASCLTNSNGTVSYCSLACNSFVSPCPMGSVCDGAAILTGNCAAACNPNVANSCRSGFSCTAIPDISGTTVYGCVLN